MFNVMNKTLFEYEEAKQELEAAKADMNCLTGNPLIDKEKILRLANARTVYNLNKKRLENTMEA